MQTPHRTRAGLVAVTIALGLAVAGCGSGSDEATSSTGSSSTPSSSSASATSTVSSSSTSRSSSSDSSAPDSSSSDSSASDSSASSSSSSKGTSSSASPSNTPDPEVSVTPAADTAQSTAQARAGMAAADATAPATRLRIPAVGLSTQIEPQGLRGGKVNPAAGQVIWFTGYDRVQPGAVGTTVVAGHVISGGTADAFAALEQLSKGDGVVLDYPGGEKLRFEVTSTQIVDKDELTTSEEVWGDNVDTRRIVLVTCDDELGFRTDGHRQANFVAVAELPA